MKKYLTVSNIVLFVIMAFFITVMGPRFLKNLNLQGQTAAYTKPLININGNNLNLSPPYALVFWATWCKPCSLELRRINSMIKSEKLDASKIITVSLDDSLETVKKTIQEKKYLFPVVWDNARELSSAYQVQGTPTIVVVGRDNKVKWATSGISPTLGVRLLRYLK